LNIAMSNPNRIFFPVQLAAVAGAMLFITGCATPKHTEQLLGQAGFHRVAANTDQQMAHLMTLPADKLTIARIDGQPCYVFPDPKRHQLYVGNQEQYDSYQQILSYQQLQRESRVLAVEDEGPGDDTIKWAQWTKDTGWTGGSN
jgi:hypothetical protein